MASGAAKSLETRVHDRMGRGPKGRVKGFVLRARTNKRDWNKLMAKFDMRFGSKHKPNLL